ncbi:MAG: glycosyltransferase family 2 protein, partial [Chitinophagaceae bacterium]
MKISICIPSYNKKGIIETTIQSVVQNLKGLDADGCSYEFVIIDDCSPDGSGEFLKELAPKYNFRFVVNKPNKGLVKNWNECIRQATGDYILILHSDDILAPGILPKYVKYIIENPDCKFIHSNAMDVLLPFFKAHLRVTQQEEVLKHGDQALQKIILNNNLACSTVMVAKECYDRLGTFDENCWVSPDWEMWA